MVDALAGSPVGETHFPRLEIPADHPVVSARGQTAVFALKASRAWELKPLDLSGSELLQRAGNYKSLDSLKEKLRADAEATAGTVLFFALFREAMRQLLERASVEVPTPLLEQVMAGEWLQVDGETLAKLEIAPPDREAALHVWLQEPSFREEMTRKIATSAMLQAIAERDSIRIDAEGMDQAVKELAKMTRLPVPQTRALLGTAEGQDLVEAIAVAAVASHVMSKVKLQIIS
jgi:FKBP-type peptidyl-prolyl cis-trans isomerase (trigger factor)